MDKNYNGHVVRGVDTDSIADQIGIKKGDRIVGFNNDPFIDIIDYIFFSSKEKLTIQYIDADGIENKVKIRKYEDEPLGIDFTDSILGQSKSCKNKCIFCFVDQLPKGMRRTLYHKDEDWRYSLIYGNYVTLANISDEDVKRIIKRDVSNLYISVHAIDHELRSMLLNNKKALDLKKILKKFAKSGIKMQTQIVLCKGINDAKALDDTYLFLKKLHPAVESISVIPAGLTQFREKLFTIEDFSKTEASNIIETIETWQSEFRNKNGVGLVYASDEMYIKANRLLPSYDSYDGFPQIENGVGMVRKFEKEFYDGLDDFVECKIKYKEVSIVTGSAFYPFLNHFCDLICKKYDIKINCYRSENSFFKGKIDVTGLLVSDDIINALKGKDIGDAVFISSTMIKENDVVFLDDVKINELEEKLGCNLVVVSNNGNDFLKCFFENNEE